MGSKLKRPWFMKVGLRLRRGREACLDITNTINLFRFQNSLRTQELTAMLTIMKTNEHICVYLYTFSLSFQ